MFLELAATLLDTLVLNVPLYDVNIVNNDSC